MKKFRLIMLALLLIVSGCTPKEQPTKEVKIEELGADSRVGEGEFVETKEGKLYKNTGTIYDAFDTITIITMYTESKEEFDRIFALAKKEFVRLHEMMDPFHTYEGITNVKTINDAAGSKVADVPEELFAVTAFAKENYEKTLGKTNVVLGTVVELWMDANQAFIDADTRDSAKIPSDEEISAALAHTNMDDLVLDEKDRSILLKDSKMRLNLGAVAKGFSTERLGEMLKKEGIVAGLISAGGNVKTIGSPPDGREFWSVGISNPRAEDESALSCVVKTEGGQSMVTSGDYQRYFMVDGVRYHHILDPLTGKPKSFDPSVTVMTEDSGLADFLSTALFLSSEEEEKEILAQYADTEMEVIRINEKGEIRSTFKDSSRIEEQK